MYLCPCVFTMHVQVPGRPDEGIGAPDTGVPGSCEMPCDCLDPDRGPLTDEPSISPAPDRPPLSFHFIDEKSRLRNVRELDKGWS